MVTLDAQVHAYERNHPGRPWAAVLHGPPDGALLVSPFAMYRYDVHAAHPGRFTLVKPVDPRSLTESVAWYLPSLTKCDLA